MTQSLNYTKNFIHIYIYKIKIEFIETLWGTDKRSHFVEIYKNYAVFPRSHQLIVVRTKLRNRSFIFYLFWCHVPLQLYPHFVFIFNSKIYWIIHLYTLYSSTFIIPSTLVNLTSTTTILLKLFIIFCIW